MKSLSIKAKLGISLCGLMMIIVFMFVMTLDTTRSQKYDGLVINLAGRQRMLTQKMTKEALNLFLGRCNRMSESDEKPASALKNTMTVFDQTLSALKNSGPAPLSLNLQDSSFSDCPKAEEPAYSQLTKVEELKIEFFAHLEKIISDQAESEKHIHAVLASNLTLLKEMNKAVGMMQNQSENRVRRLIASQVIGLVAGTIFFLCAFWMVRSIVVRLRQVGIFADRLGTGDFSTESGIAGYDELGSIGKNLDTMVNNLSQMFVTVKDETVHIHQSAEALKGLSQKIGDGAGSSAERSYAVSAAAEEMSVNFSAINDAVQRTADNINRIAETAGGLSGTIGEIAQNSGRAQDITKNAVDKSRASGEKVKQLNQAAYEIGNVSETILTIAAQTNLLALNATIEAARAGEAGKGFTVVANEIKELAQQTSGATDEITNKVKSIQEFTEITMRDILDIGSIVSEIDTIVREISVAVDEQSQATQDIAANVNESSLSMSDVNSNITQGTMVAAEVAKDISTVSHAATELNDDGQQLQKHSIKLSELADHLRKSLNKFKLTT